ncbi:hypothetical protein [Flavobacterium sp.]|uniref:hypothetical protein n=1 Tax=Flavobacterium sp. TaxID=239 RepID=UPI003918B663
MYFYEGYSYRDNVAGNIAAFFALLVAFFPTEKLEGTTLTHQGIMIEESLDVASKIHYISAALFFLTLTYFSLFLFVLKGSNLTDEKKKRNRIYKMTGYVMIACIVLIATYFSLDKEVQAKYNLICKPIIILETIALWAFGISWVTKSNVIFRDKETDGIIIKNLPNIEKEKDTEHQ